MIPTTTNAIRALEWVMPELSGRIQGYSMRVPTQNVSCVDLTVEFSREVTETEIMGRCISGHKFRAGCLL